MASSRFFATGDSDVESDVSSSEESEEIDMTSGALGGAGQVKLIYSSSESEDEKRTIRSAKDKHWEHIQTTTTAMRNHMKISDWCSVAKDWELLLKQMDKAKNVVAKEGYPPFFLNAVGLLQQNLNAAHADKEALKKMSSSNSKALNSLKSKVKKSILPPLSTILDDHLKKNPIPSGGFPDAESSSPKKGKSKKPVSDSDSEQDSEQEKQRRKPPTATRKRAKSSSESDESSSSSSSSGGSSSSSSSSSSGSDSDSDSSSGSEVEASNAGAAWFTREFWVKKDYKKSKGSDSESSESSSESESEDDRDTRRARHAEREAAKRKKESAQHTLKEDQEKRNAEEEKKAAEEELKPEQMIKRLKDLLSLRGKRGTDVSSLISELKSLRARSEKVAHPAALLKLNVTLMASLFDLNLNKITKSKDKEKAGEYMAIKSWKEAVNVMDQLIQQLLANSDIRLSEDEKQDETFLDEAFSAAMVADDEKSGVDGTAAVSPVAASASAAAPAPAPAATPSGPFYVVGSLLGFAESLVREYTKSLLHIDPHSLEYIERLKDESSLINILTKVQGYYEFLDKKPLESKVCVLRLELIYYRFYPELDALSQKLNPVSTVSARSQEEGLLVPSLAHFLYKHGDQKSRIRGLLMHVFWLALHNRYNESRELLLMSHLQESVHDLGMKTRILYNRCIAVLGVAAFKQGDFRQSVDALAELHQSGKLKELLAQGVSMNKWHDRDIEDEDASRRRQYPYHQHLNLDSLEAIHLLSAMLLEVPNLALHGSANHRRTLSRIFRRMWEHHQRQAFSGPPENTRDLIMTATKHLSRGEWEQAYEMVGKLRMWEHMKKSAGGEPIKQHVLALVLQKLKEEACRTYLITYSRYFVNIDKSHLAKMFDLTVECVHKVLSKLMVHEQLLAAWDEPHQLLAVQQQAPNKLQKAALAFSDKAIVFLEANERLLDTRTGERRPERQQKDENGAREKTVSLRGRFRGGARGGGRGRGRGRGGRT